METRASKLEHGAVHARMESDPSEVQVQEANAATKATAPAMVATNCIDAGHGNGSVAPSFSNGAVGLTNMVVVTGAGVG